MIESLTNAKFWFWVNIASALLNFFVAAWFWNVLSLTNVIVGGLNLYVAGSLMRYAFTLRK